MYKTSAEKMKIITMYHNDSHLLLLEKSRWPALKFHINDFSYFGISAVTLRLRY